uniref:Myb/SANT-like domain-containing protein n=1 Tax=Romanomermis culicivorax TaxID=13658 RepID=A0A915JEJ2_ROMCU
MEIGAKVCDNQHPPDRNGGPNWPFTETSLTKEDKSEAWQTVVKNCIEMHGFDRASENGWKYLRDTVWPSSRQCTVVKRDAKRSTMTRRLV